MAELVFSVDSALLSELGEKLVESVHVALLELIKNSYDADASAVQVGIYPSSEDGCEIFIIDNGLGMSFDDVQQYWMRIATTNKVDENTSTKYGRPKSGAKGIGRFSCRRLGTHLTLKTTAKLENGTYQNTEMVIDWTRFKRGENLENVVCDAVVTESESGVTGTILELRQGATHFTKRSYDYIKRYLAVLVANRGAVRKGFEPDPGFDVELECPDYEGGVVNLRDELINAGWGTVSARIDAKGRAVCTLDAMPGAGRKNTVSSHCFEHLKDVTLKFGILILDKTQVRNSSSLSLGKMKEVINDWGGIYVRYKGIRVAPYGDRGDDWLSIDQDRGLRKGVSKQADIVGIANEMDLSDKRYLLQLASSRSYVGDVEISSDTANGFELKASREGFLDSPAVRELRKFVRFAVDWSTVHRHAWLEERSKKTLDDLRDRFVHEVIAPEKRQTFAEDKPAREAVEYLRSEFKNIVKHVPATQRPEIRKNFELATEYISKHEEYNEGELSHLRLVASTSTLLLIFSHDVRSFLAELDTMRMDINKLVEEHPKLESSLRTIEIRLGDYKNRFEQLVQLTSIVSNIKKDGKAMPLALHSRLEKARSCFSLILDSYNVTIDIDQIPPAFRAGPVLEAELYALLINILSNAVKAVIAAGGEKHIKVDVEKVAGKSRIIFRDNGIGVDLATSDDLFKAFIADPSGELYEKLGEQINPEDELFVGTGSGLGLGIVRSIIERRHGSIKFVQPEKGWNTKLEVIL